MKFSSSFVQYPRPLTYVIMLFDLLMMLVLAKFAFILLFAAFLGIGFALIPFPVSSIALILTSFWCFISMYGLWLDLGSCSISGLKMDGKVTIDRFGAKSEYELKKLEGLRLVEARLLLPLCHYALIKTENSETVAELTRTDFDELARIFGETGRFRIPFFLSIIWLRTADLHKIPST